MMLHLKDRLPKSGLTAFSVSVFHQAVVLLLLTDCCGVLSQVIGPSQPVIVTAGDDIILPCHLRPAVDAVGMTLEWARPDLNPRFVHVWHDRQDLQVNQNPSYRGRTSLSIEKLKHGDISLKLSKVKLSDNGKYRCYIPYMNKDSTVQLVVGTASSPVISLAGIDTSSSGVVLQCESKGWYPKPDVFWLDSEGNFLSVGPTETVKGPDDLYTVSSRVTVEKRHNNNFTCKVQQKNINQTRETHFIVPDDFFMAPSSCAASVTFSVLFAFMFILAVVIFLLKWRQHKIEQNLLKEGEDTREQLIESKKMVDLEKEKAKLNEELQKEVEEQKYLEQMIEILKKHKEDLMKQKGTITVQMESTRKLVEENEAKLNLMEKEISEKKGDKTANRGQGYSKLKEIIKETNWKLEERKKEEQTLEMTVDKVVKMTEKEFIRMTNKNKQLQSDIEKINKQLEKINRQQYEIQEKPKSETKQSLNIVKESLHLAETEKLMY